MSDLKKIKIVVKNYDVQGSGDLDALYSRVRLEDAQGNTFYFKQVVMPKYLRQHGAMAMNVPRTWFYKHVSKKSIVVIAFENASGKVEYDLSDLQLIARSTVIKGILMTIAAIPMGVIAATATYGLGLILIPMGFWIGYRNIFKLPAMLSRKRILSDFSAHGITVR